MPSANVWDDCGPGGVGISLTTLVDAPAVALQQPGDALVPQCLADIQRLIVLAVNIPPQAPSPGQA